MNKILVSACLLGEKVRYDGNCQRQHHIKLAVWQQQGRIISICPEVSGGLSIPREPAEMQTDGRIITQQRIDVTNEFISGANKALLLCKKYQIRYALLKESSPSCGSNSVYDGTFSGQKIEGMGVTAKLLQAHGIKVFSEQQINELSGLLE
ncbi:DUF523 domain-containing protein [Thalassotalea piscium]|uniref:Uncharacterized protein YbbK (DUF523 family) n=1 Tax=Thalassotalea piscium TaxID=1230533 RepID=A0A7X0TSW4_9GAMM|nr:DUF523 domain-containing protein [Thalassotalea piscium]MBB6542563.1 uncharacterized protein YbbK (DUF523 family) [Thalassotalea piscium]